MRFSDYLAAEWRPALGCTEPAAIAFAAAHAASLAGGPIRAAHLVCDARIFKNCYAVGIPNAAGKHGIRWAIALGSVMPDPGGGLEIFSQCTPETLAEARHLIDSGAITVEVDKSCTELHVDCRVIRSGGIGRAVLDRDHTRLTRLEKDGQRIGPAPEREPQGVRTDVRAELAAMPLSDLVAFAHRLESPDREALRHGTEVNLSLARLGLEQQRQALSDEPLTRAGQRVAAAVCARMAGANRAVLSLAGSGNKGITTSVAISTLGESFGASREAIDGALALACLLTSSATHYLGSLSATCGCVAAAGIGLSAGLVQLQGGDEAAIARTICNMVGSVPGMICDGAKLGCGLKTAMAVDSAYRSAALALRGIGISSTDGIVGDTPEESLAALGQIANAGMAAMDDQILAIMQGKLRRHAD